MNTGRWSLLSITDIHYESPNTNFLDDPKELQWAGVRDNVFPQFNRILENAFSRESFDLIAVGGDITTHGKKTGFTTFTNDALPSLRKLVRRNQAVCIVPGNHDVTWNLDPTRRGAFQTKFREFRALADRSHATSCLFPDGELIEKLDDNLTLIRPQYGPIYRDDDRKLLVLCINSAIRCGELNKQMKKEIDTPAGRALKEVKKKPRGSATTDLTNLTQAMQKYLIRDVAHVTQAQRGELADILQSQQQELGEDWASFLRVAIVHHHLIHFPGQLTEHKSYELLIDSADVLGLLADFDFDLVLTGHKRQPYAVPHLTGSKELLLIGGPTVGGYAPDNSFRGIRQIDISDHGDHRSFKITNIPNTVGQGSVAAGMEQCVREADSKDVPRSPVWRGGGAPS